MSFTSLSMYYLWARRNTDAPSEWNRMAYTGRTYLDCSQLRAYYESEWGNHYEYMVLPSSLEPKSRVAIR